MATALAKGKADRRSFAYPLRAGDETAVAGVDLDLLAGLEVRRHLQTQAGLEHRLFGLCGGGGVFHCGRRLGHHQFDHHGEVDVDHALLEDAELHFGPVQQKWRDGFEVVFFHLELLVGLKVHEDAAAAIGIEELPLVALEVGFVYLVARTEGLL